MDADTVVGSSSMFTAPWNGDGSPAVSGESDDASLEAVELEFALTLQNLAEHSFRDCAENAAAEIGGEILFELRIEDDPNYQKAIAIGLQRSVERHVFIILLSRDGNTMRLASPLEGQKAVSGLAHSFSDVARLYGT